MKKLRLIIYIAMLIVVAACTQAVELEPSPYGAENETADISVVMTPSEIDKNAESATLVITNLSDNEYIFGAPYALETQRDGAWFVYPPKEELAWIDIAYILEPGGSNEETISINSLYGTLESGTYRVVKTFMQLGEPEQVAFAKFTVK